MSKITLKVGGYTFDKFTRFSLGLNYNSIASTFSFEGFFDINNPEHKKLFKPLTYPLCQVFYNDKLILTGTVLSTGSAISGESHLTAISGYSKPGVLEDCEIPSDLYPLQSDGMNLKEIAQKLIANFGIGLVVDSNISGDVNSLFSASGNNLEGGSDQETATEGDESQAIPQQTANQNEKIKEYLANIAKQRQIILTHNAYGNLVFTRLSPGRKAITAYTEGQPATKIALSCNGQELHSSITIQGQAQLESSVGTKETISNPLVKVYRPTIKEQTSGNGMTAIKTAQMARGSELRAIQLTIDTNTWEWFDGKQFQMILPNSIIYVTSPSNFLANKSKWFVESVDLTGDHEKTTASIKCVLPEVYTGETSQYIFS